MKRKIFTLMLSMILMLQAIPVCAANTADEAWTFNINNYSETRIRTKENTTPTYVLVDSTSVKAKIQVWGPVTVGSSLVWQNQTQFVSAVVASPGVQSSIHTTVYEEGGRYARLKGYSLDSKSSSTGVWSPDSTRNYTFLN